VKKNKIFFTVIMIMLVTGFNQAWSGPTIIRDSRITDTAITPVLGRGYSIGTNTFQSTCMEDVVITEPSYDFTYTFDSIEKARDRKRTTKSESSTAGTQSSEYKGKRSYRDNSGRWRGTNSAQYRSAYKRMRSRSGKFTGTGTEKLYSHIIEANIKVITYYASVDEAKSKLSESAASLLTKKDLPGFFNSCGPYYVRSIGREATFLSFFEYKTKTTTRDLAFERTMEDQIKGFRSSTYNYDWAYKKSKYKYTGQSEYKGEYESKSKSKTAAAFNEKASQMHLTITTLAFGLGKSKGAKLIAYDIDTFKSAIKDAFVSMQNERTGKVVNMEVVPWVENTQFQTLVELESGTEEYENVFDASGKQVLDKDGNPVTRLKPQLMLYEKKMLLNENAEFIIEIDRVDRNIMNMYYKAKLCRRNIDMNWKKDGNFKEGLEEASVQNKRDLDQTMALKLLDETVSKARIFDILNIHKVFMYGDPKKKDGGANACMRAVMKEGIFKVSYRDIKACQPVIENMGEIQNDIIDNYCLPELAD